MKFSTTFFLAVMAVFFLACSNNETNSAAAPQSADPANPAAPAPATNNPATTTPVAAAGVQHYICPNNCAGSGGATAGSCPVCGSQYQHNQAYHNQGQNTTTPTTTTNTPVAAAGVQHYICPNNCAGSGGATAGTCPVCGSQYQHNQAYHNQPSTSTTTTTVTPNDQGNLSPLFQNNSQQPQVNVPRISSPTNASGQYHYVCSNGCSGGSATAGSCPSCGSALAHNAAYHQ